VIPERPDCRGRLSAVYCGSREGKGEKMGKMLKDWIAGLPKVELHVHLEGAIPAEALWELVKKYDTKGEYRSFDQIAARYAFRDFPHFIETWNWKSGFISEYDDFTMIAEGFARYLESQKVLYAEAHFSPPEFASKGLSIGRIAEAVRNGLSRVPGTSVALIGDVVRQLGPEQAGRSVREYAELREYGVIGIGLGGLEREYPPELFTEVFTAGERLGLHRTAHAGEAAGEESVRNAVKYLNAERIGHGTAIHDMGFLAELTSRGIAIEMCPLSNVRTRSIAALEDHPIRRFFAAGALVCINTDDPAMFGNPLNEEYETAALRFGFSTAELRRLGLNAIRASWAPEAEKARLAARVAGYDPPA